MLYPSKFIYMFDPYKTRYNSGRYYTKKGQVIQARVPSVSAPIDNAQVDKYLRYIIKNNLYPVQNDNYGTLSLKGNDYIWNELSQKLPPNSVIQTISFDTQYVTLGPTLLYQRILVYGFIPSDWLGGTTYTLKQLRSAPFIMFFNNNSVQTSGAKFACYDYHLFYYLNSASPFTYGDITIKSTGEQPNSLGYVFGKSKTSFTPDQLMFNSNSTFAPLTDAALKSAVYGCYEVTLSSPLYSNSPDDTEVTVTDFDFVKAANNQMIVLYH